MNFAIRTEAMISVSYIHRLPDGRHHAQFLEPTECRKGDDPLALATEITATIRVPAYGVGLAVGVVRDGRLEFYGHGVADLQSGAPITEDTVFRIASITKTFTAAAVTSSRRSA